jgi:hypothetical protein
VTGGRLGDRHGRRRSQGDSYRDRINIGGAVAEKSFAFESQLTPSCETADESIDIRSCPSNWSSPPPLTPAVPYANVLSSGFGCFWEAWTMGELMLEDFGGWVEVTNDINVGVGSKKKKGGGAVTGRRRTLQQLQSAYVLRRAGRNDGCGEE